MKNLLFILLLVSTAVFSQTYVDKAYIQDYADKFELNTYLEGTELQQVECDRNGVIKITSSNGILQAFEKQLLPDLQYRALTNMQIIATTNYRGQFVYLTDKAVLSNSWAGKFYFEHQIENPNTFILGKDFMTLVASDDELVLFENKNKVWSESIDFKIKEFIYDEESDSFLILTNNALYTLNVASKELSKSYEGTDFNSMAIFHKNKIALGTSNGIIFLDKKTYRLMSSNQKLPWTEITTLKNIDETLWIGSTKGTFKLKRDGKYDYYASKRWLVDDEVIDISEGPDKSILVLTKLGLSKINFVPMTLANKAAYFQKIQRLRHVRYGLESTVQLNVAGDLSTAVLIDTDNDGLWTSMYLAGELFRYAVTKSEDAKLNAYEAFEAMERLTEVSGIDGFPARTYEVDGYQFSDADTINPKHKNVWRTSDKDPRWKWKTTTSSDESCGHFFAYALFAEIIKDKEWRDRAIHQIKIQMDHLIDNEWTLTTWNGEPTEWGKFNPEYLNSFPTNVMERRLNSTLILSFLQTAYHFTGDEKYEKEAKKLIKKYGYDDNANRLATEIGFVEGEELSDEWNHSDDEMYFLTIPAFVSYSFSEEQKKKHFISAKSHWKVELSEKNPLWNYLFSLAGGGNNNVKESAQWLKEFPMDLIDWNVDNSHRKDLTKLEPNFRNQTYTEVLPPDERVLSLHNNAYRNNGGSEGKIEYSPYLYLMPYWAGRYVYAISEK